MVAKAVNDGMGVVYCVSADAEEGGWECDGDCFGEVGGIAKGSAVNDPAGKYCRSLQTTQITTKT